MDKFGKRKDKKIVDDMDLDESSQSSRLMVGNKRRREETVVYASYGKPPVRAPLTADEKKERLAQSQKKFDDAQERCRAVNNDVNAYEAECSAKIAAWRLLQPKCEVCVGCGHSAKDCPWLKKLLTAAGILDPSIVPYLYLLKSADWLAQTKRYTK